jgi:hypothetical protein
MSIGTYPTLIVLEKPGYATSGTHKYRCMICMRFFRISDSSYATVYDMRRTSKGYIIACFGCFQDLEPMLPDEMKAGRQEASISRARQIMGFHNA